MENAMKTDTTKHIQTGRPITAYKRKMTPVAFYRGRDRYEFVRYSVKDKDGSVPLSQLADDEIVVWPGEIYRRARDAKTGLTLKTTN
jgi:hypothetical protein